MKTSKVNSSAIMTALGGLGTRLGDLKIHIDGLEKRNDDNFSYLRNRIDGLGGKIDENNRKIDENLKYVISMTASADEKLKEEFHRNFRLGKGIISTIAGLIFYLCVAVTYEIRTENKVVNRSIETVGSKLGMTQ